MILGMDRLFKTMILLGALFVCSLNICNAQDSTSHRAAVMDLLKAMNTEQIIEQGIEVTLAARTARMQELEKN